MLEIEEIMDDEEKGWKQELESFYNSHPDIQRIWDKIANDILPALYVEIRNRKEAMYYLEFREINEKLICGLFQIGAGNLEKRPEHALFKRLITGSSIFIDDYTLERLLQFALLKINQDKEAFIPEILLSGQALSIRFFDANHTLGGKLRRESLVAYPRTSRCLNTNIKTFKGE